MGNAVAATAANLRALMRGAVNRLDQTEFVSRLNRQFADMSVDGAYATAIVTTFFSPTRRLSIWQRGPSASHSLQRSHPAVDVPEP
jgi:sigma-B regulation protein RsbU (phosphoserine phosphatase)